MGLLQKKIFEKFAEKGIVGLAFWENGFRELSNNVRPVTTPADLNGIKMRTLPATVQVEHGRPWELCPQPLTHLSYIRHCSRVLSARRRIRFMKLCQESFTRYSSI